MRQSTLRQPWTRPFLPTHLSPSCWVRCPFFPFLGSTRAISPRHGRHNRTMLPETGIDNPHAAAVSNLHFKTSPWNPSSFRSGATLLLTQADHVSKLNPEAGRDVPSVSSQLCQDVVHGNFVRNLPLHKIMYCGTQLVIYDLFETQGQQIPNATPSHHLQHGLGALQILPLGRGWDWRGPFAPSGSLEASIRMKSATDRSLD